MADLPGGCCLACGVKDSFGWRFARRQWYRTLEHASPTAFCAWNRRFPDRVVVDATTDLVIEGYPSAANSQARETFILTQPGISVASHLHSATHVRRALKLEVPVLIVLRPPVDSIASVMARFPDGGFRPGPELKRYEHFYTEVSTLASQVALSRFSDTVGRLGTMIRIVNSQLGTEFVPFVDGDPAIVEHVRAALDAWSAWIFGERSMEATARPSDARHQALEDARAAIRIGRYAQVLAHCEQLHANLDGLAERRVRAWETTQAAQSDGDDRCRGLPVGRSEDSSSDG